MDAWKIWRNGDREDGRWPSGKGTVKDGGQTPAKGREKGDRRDDRPLGKGIRGGNGGKEEGWQFSKGSKPDPLWGQDINVGVPFEDGSHIQGSDSRDPRWQSRFSNPWDNSWLLSQDRSPVVGAENWVLTVPASQSWVANGPARDERWHGRTRQWQAWQEDDRWWEKSWDASTWQHSDSPPSNWKEERSMLEERLRKAEAHGKNLEAALAAMKGIGKGAEMNHDRHDDDNGGGWHFPGKGSRNNGDNMHHDFGRNMSAQNLGANQMPVGNATPRIQRATPAIQRTSGRSLPPPSRRQDAPASPDNTADLWASYRPSTSSSFPIGAAAPARGAPLPTQAPSTWLDREVQVDERGIAPWQPPLLQNVQVAAHAPAQGRLWAGPSGSATLASNGSSFAGQSYSGYVRTPRGDAQDANQQMQMARHNSRQFERNSFSSAGGCSCGGPWSEWSEGAASVGGGNSTKGGKGTRGPRHHSKGPRENNWWHQDQAQAGKDGRRYREPGGGRDGNRAQKVTAVLSRGASLGSAPRARPKSSAAGHAAAAVRPADIEQANVVAVAATALSPAEVNESVAQAPEGGGGDAAGPPEESTLDAAEVAQVSVEEAVETTSGANASALEAAPAEGEVGAVATEEEECAAARNERVDADVETLWPSAAEDEANKEAGIDDQIAWPLAAEDEARNETSAGKQADDVNHSISKEEEEKGAAQGDEEEEVLASVTYQ